MNSALICGVTYGIQFTTCQGPLSLRPALGSLRRRTPYRIGSLCSCLFLFPSVFFFYSPSSTSPRSRCASVLWQKLTVLPRLSLYPHCAYFCERKKSDSFPSKNAETSRRVRLCHYPNGPHRAFARLGHSGGRGPYSPGWWHTPAALSPLQSWSEG